VAHPVSAAALLLLADGRTPTGGHAHSGGLEAAVEEDGLAPSEVPAFLAGRLEGVIAAEAGLAVAAARAARIDDLEALAVLDDEALARVVVPALRAAASRLGRQLLRTATTVWPHAAIIARYAGSSDHTPRCVAHGVVAAAAGLDDRGTALALLHEEAGTVAGAAVRLLPVDPAVATRWIARSGPRLEALADAAAAARLPPERLPAGFAPAIELRAVRHAEREGRLFAT
jgi:urease accessory protein